MPVSGVRMSCARPASAASIARAAALRRRGRGVRSPRSCARAALSRSCAYAIPYPRREHMPRKRRSIEPDQPADIGRRRALGAQFAQARWRASISTACGRRHRGSAGDGGKRGAGRPSSACSRRCTLVGEKQILAAHHVGHALQRRRRPRPRDDSWSASPCAPAMTSPQAAGSAAICRFRRRPVPVSRPAQRAGARQRRCHVEAQRVGLAGGDAALRARGAIICLAHRRDRAARRRDRAASARASRVATRRAISARLSKLG